jgi:hypothetical protein
MKVSAGEPFELDAVSLTAIGDDATAVSDLDVRAAELADGLATAGLLQPADATGDALRLRARTRSGRAATGWSVR